MESLNTFYHLLSGHLYFSFSDVLVCLFRHSILFSFFSAADDTAFRLPQGELQHAIGFSVSKQRMSVTLC